MDAVQTVMPEAAHVASISLLACMFAVSRSALRTAKRKGYAGKILLWAWVPGVNLCALLVCSTLPDKCLRRKTDELAARLMPPSRKTSRPAATKSYGKTQ